MRMRIILTLSILLVSTTLKSLAGDWDTTSLPRGYNYRLSMKADGVVYAISDSVLYSSSDEGSTWSVNGKFIRNGYLRSLSFSPDGVLFGSDFALGVFRSTNNGLSWSSNLVTEGCNGLAVHPDGYVFAGLTYTGNGKVHRSADWGTTWSSVPLPNSTNSFATECFTFGQSITVYAGAIDGFYRSTDFGLSWIQQNSGLLGKHVRVMTVDPDGVIFIQTIYSSSFDGLYRSTNGSNSWQRVGGNDPYFSTLVSAPNGDLIGSSDTGIFRSRDKGLMWIKITSELSAFEQFSSVVVTPSGKIVAGGRNVYRSRTALTSSPMQSVTPIEFALHQNFPNPFNPTTTISFSIPKRTFVSLTVHNILGQRIATVVNGEREAGQHNINFDAAECASGMYFYRLSDGSTTLTRKMQIIK